MRTVMIGYKCECNYLVSACGWDVGAESRLGQKQPPHYHHHQTQVFVRAISYSSPLQ